MFLYNYTYIVYENETVGSFVGIVSATDQDEGINAVVRYQILSPTMSVLPFMLDQNNGHILVNGQLDRETNPYYTLIVNSLLVNTAKRLLTFV